MTFSLEIFSGVILNDSRLSSSRRRDDAANRAAMCQSSLFFLF